MSIIIRLQNLPWAADSVDIRRYFSGLSIPEGGVHIVGGEMGDAFIGFSTDEDARLAMAKDGGKIQGLQIKLFLSSRTEMMRVIERARQQNFALQAHMSPIQTPPAMPLQQQPMVASSPLVDSDRRRDRSPSPHRRSRDKSPPRDRRRSPDSRRSKRERSRSPARGTRGSSRDTDRRTDRYKRDDRRYDDAPRYRDDRYSGRQDVKKYPESDNLNRPRGNQPGDFRDGPNRGGYESPSALAPNAGYNVESSRSVSSSEYPTSSYNSHSEKNLMPHGTGNQGGMDAPPSFNQPDLYSLVNPAFNLPSYKQPASSNKESVPTPHGGDEFGKRPRRSRFEPEYASSEAPYFPSSAEQKPESARETVHANDRLMNANDSRPINQEYGAPSRNAWPQQNINLQNRNWSDKNHPSRDSLIPKNRDVSQVVPMDIESSPVNIPPDKSPLSQPNQYSSQRSSRPFPLNSGPTGDNKGMGPNEKQWSKPSSMVVEVRGIPLDLRMKEIFETFRNMQLTVGNICIVTNNRGAEKALIRFMRASDYEEAVNGPPRYVRNYRCEIVPSSNAAFEAASAPAGSAPKPRPHKPKPNEEDFVIQLRGLPFSCREADLTDFFENLTIADMVVEYTPERKAIGALVQFTTQQDFRTALTMNGKTMGQRYVIIAVASKDHITAARALMNQHPPHQTHNQRPKSPTHTHGPLGPNLDPPRPSLRPNIAPGGPRNDPGGPRNDPMPQHPRNDPMPQHPRNDPMPQHPRNDPMSQHPRNDPMPQHPRNDPMPQHPRNDSMHPRNDPMPQHPRNDPMQPPNRPENFCIHLRGMSDRVTNKAIADFFNEIGISVKAIHLILTPEKIPSGEGFIEISNKEEADRALSKHNTVLLGHRISATPIPFQEMTRILSGPALLPSPLLNTPVDPDRPRRPLLSKPPTTDGPFNDHGDFPPNNYQNFDGPPNGRPGPGPGPRGERPHFPPGGDRPRHDFPRPDGPRGDRPFFRPRGDGPRMDGPPMRGMRPPMNHPMRPPFGRMRGPFPPRPRGAFDPQAARDQGDIGPPGCVVCIDNLHFKAGFSELLDFFKGYGLVKDNIVRWLDEHQRPTSKARVAFRNPWDAERVVNELNHKTIMGRSLKLSIL